MLIRRLVACSLVVLLAVPAWSNTKVVGVVSSGHGASVSGGPVAQGTTLFSGDIINVGAKGSALLTLGSDNARVIVRPDSSVQLVREDERVAFELTRGQVAFRLNAKMAEAWLHDLTIVSVDESSLGVVLWKSPNNVMVGAEAGTLRITSATSGKTVTLRKGEAMEATLSQGVAPEEQKKKLRRRGVLILSGVIIGLATVVGLVVSANESDLKQPPGKVVSPFIP